jgi:hypothetical protein
MGYSIPPTLCAEAVKGDLMPLQPKIIRYHPHKQLFAKTSGDVEDSPAFLAQKVMMMFPLNEFIAGRSIFDQDGNDLMGFRKSPQGAVDRSHAQKPPKTLRNPEDIGGKQRPGAVAENLMNYLLLDGPSFAHDPSH